MRYVSARIEETAREKAYRIYVTDALRGLYGAEKGVMRYADIFAPKHNRTEDEIKASIFEKLKKMGGEEE